MMQTDSPDLAEMLAGYARFRDEGWTPYRERWAKLHEGQSPRVMVIACSDSRVDPSQIFDVDPGQIFVVRNVAALVPPYETTPGQHGVSAALEFAVQFLKVREILVMGHGMCGGCAAALSQDLRGSELGSGGFVANWITMLDDVRDSVVAEEGVEGQEAGRAMEMAAVKVSLSNLRTFPFVQEGEGAGTLKLRGAHFAISDGILRILNNESGQFEPA